MKADTALVIAFIVVVLLFAVFGGGAIDGYMNNGRAEGSGWTADHTWMLSPALIAFGFGVVLFRVISKRDLLQLEWEKGNIHRLGRTFPHRLGERTNAVRFTQSTAKNFMPAVLGLPRHSSN